MSIEDLLKRAAGVRMNRKTGRAVAKLIGAAARRELSAHEVGTLAQALNLSPTDLQSIAKGRS